MGGEAKRRRAMQDELIKKHKPLIDKLLSMPLTEAAGAEYQTLTAELKSYGISLVDQMPDGRWVLTPMGYAILDKRARLRTLHGTRKSGERSVQQSQLQRARLQAVRQNVPELPRAS